MCSICGILGNGIQNIPEILKEMSAVMQNRGPDQNGMYFSEGIALAHNRLSIIDVENGKQPMTRTYKGRTCTIVYNGELYNTPELTAIVREKGIDLMTHCDTEVVLYMYLLFGEKCASMLNGIFAFAVYDEVQRQVYLARDRFGIKPLFYAQPNGAFIFASEIKALLRYPGVRSAIDQEGLWELLFLSPVRLNGGIFKDVEELEPAHYAIWSSNGLSIGSYWNLKAKECTESRDDMIEHTRALLTDSIERQLVSDVPLCTLLSGGLDSSIISAVAAEYYKQHGRLLSTYSFEYEGNRENFHTSLFQPQSDDEYARYMAAQLGTNHTVLTASTEDVRQLLGPAVLARDFPGQADIDSSLLYYCRRIKEHHTVAMSGECADEIFGGYPWFYRPEMLENPFFPWIHEPMLRASLFQDSIVKSKDGYACMQAAYRKSMEACPMLDCDSTDMRTSRLATWVSVHYFMASLLERKDRMSMAASVEVRVPFADHRILEYVYNIPWEIKFENHTEKALLRNAMADWLPDKIKNRKKSPYPKTQNPAYEAAVLAALRDRLKNTSSALGNMLNKEAFEDFLNAENKTWFGQLMGRPQLLAWLLQFDIWCEAYHIDFI